MKRSLSFSGKIAVVALGFAASWAVAQADLPKTMVRIEHSLVTLIHDVPVPAREAGSLMELTAREGDIVQSGDVLGQLDNLDALAKRDMADSELEVAQAQAASTAELEAAQQGSQVALEEQKQLEHIQKKNDGAVSIFELRRARFNYDKSLAQIKVAQTDRTVAQITTKLKTAQITATDNELARRQVQSPLGGQVVEVYKHVGEWCTPGEPILRVVRLDRVRVEGFVLTSAASPNNVLGRPVTVTVHTAGGGTHQVKGSIGFASQLVEGAGSTRQFRVWTEVDNTQVAGGWAIQPGSAAEMLIDMNAPIVRSTSPRRESTPTNATSNSGGAFRPQPLPPSGSKFESRKPSIEAAPSDGTPATLPPELPAQTTSEPPTNPAVPKAEAPKTEAPKAEAPKIEAPKTEAPKTETTKPEATKPEPARGPILPTLPKPAPVKPRLPRPF